MSDYIRPNIIISKCLGFAECRYNGLKITSDFVEGLKPFVKFYPVCPELEIGLGVPRDPIRLIEKSGILKLIQPATGRNVTQEMKSFASMFLESLGHIDGFILKSRSPSCGLKDTKIYQDVDRGQPIRKDSGFFGGLVKKNFSELALEDEKRLLNSRIHDHFLSKIFTLSAFRKVHARKSIKSLIDFHTRYKYLLMAYNQKRLKELGRITANPEKKDINTVIGAYRDCLYKALARAPRCSSNVNVLMHLLGYFSKELKSKEKAFFLRSIDNYRHSRETLAASKKIIESWIIRFDQKYLENQAFLEPYPEELITVENIDTCKVRDYWD